MEQQPVCSFEGNKDLYGVGLRSGLYIQCVALARVNYSSQDPRFNRDKKSGIHHLRGKALIYILANFIAMLHADRNRCVRDVEVVILLLELLPQLNPMVKVSRLLLLGLIIY
jgi:hypothetical protein